MTEIKFIHLDDQPENINWIPLQLSSWVWSNYRDKLTTYPSLFEDDQETRFKLVLPTVKDPIIVHYLIAEDLEEFWSLYGESEDQCSGIILDQWIGQDRNAGAKLYRQIVDTTSTDAGNILIMTAYPQETCLELGWTMPHDQLLIKPPRQAEVMTWLNFRLAPQLS